jgi:hypothetical protein
VYLGGGTRKAPLFGDRKKDPQDAHIHKIGLL